MIRILIVDDDPSFIQLLQTTVRNRSKTWDLHWARDGAEAIDFLYRRNSFKDAPTPDLILLDINMPRVNGLQALAVIKRDPVLSLIPIIMLSSSTLPAEVRKIYEAHANAFVEKAPTLERFRAMITAIEAFWMDCVILPPVNRDSIPTGPSAAEILSIDSNRDLSALAGVLCPTQEIFRQQFAAAVKELIALHERHFQAVVAGDRESGRFDSLIQAANEKKQKAMDEYLRHIRSHGCANLNAVSSASGGK